jgi:hypothetical protein
VPGPLSDCYVLAAHRSYETLAAFLELYAPVRVPLWNTNEPPIRLAGFKGVATESRLVDFLVVRPAWACTLYFRCTHPSVSLRAEFSIVSFNDDGSLILGLSGPEIDGSALLGSLERLSNESGYWTIEEAPASSRTEFRAKRARRQRQGC